MPEAPPHNLCFINRQLHNQIKLFWLKYPHGFLCLYLLLCSKIKAVVCYSNLYIMMTLGTSMAAIFGLEELTGRAFNVNAITFRSIEIFIITAVLYFIITVVASAILVFLGRWLFRVKGKVF